MVDRIDESKSAARGHRVLTPPAGPWWGEPARSGTRDPSIWSELRAHIFAAACMLAIGAVGSSVVPRSLPARARFATAKGACSTPTRGGLLPRVRIAVPPVPA